ncbi:MAG: glycosyltransferase family 2 protein, partial [Lysobacteraceae bacterium]
MHAARIAVVIPCYRVAQHVLDVIAAIPAECERIYAVDDACPDDSGKLIQSQCTDPRVQVIFHEKNSGVGGAVISGYRHALDDGMDIVVKIDGDGQMDASLLPRFVAPLLRGQADYAKGNRFFDLRNISKMPMIRVFGNAVLSFFSKLSTGYWDLFDPTNGYTAIHANALRMLPLDKLSQRWFFETDLLFRLGTVRAVVQDIPMDARYGNEVSGLRVPRILGEFLFKHLRNFSKRIFYNYFLRDMALASIELPAGVALLAFGLVYGSIKWVHSHDSGSLATAGTVMLAALPVIVGLQFILAFLAYDIA